MCVIDLAGASNGLRPLARAAPLLWRVAAAAATAVQARTKIQACRRGVLGSDDNHATMHGFCADHLCHLTSVILV